jgi:DNA-binding IclR family transcriptional regulator
VLPTRSLARLARPSLAELSAGVGEAAGLSVPDGDLVHYVEQVDTPNPVSVRDWTGSRLPMHAVSSGQVLLAFRQPAAVERFLDASHERFTDRTLVSPEALRERLREVRRNGFAWTQEEFDHGINSVAAPIADATGEVVAAVHIHGPSYRFPAPGQEGTIARRVVTTAAHIAENLRQA